MQSHQLINQSSGVQDYGTPETIVDLARMVMCGIDLDPASSELWNNNVRAAVYYTEPEYMTRTHPVDGLPWKRPLSWGGLDERWYGRVFMNHPFGSPERACSHDCKKTSCVKRGYHLEGDLPGNADWVNKMVDSYRQGLIVAGICITFASTSEKWFQPLKQFPQCYIDGRTNYLDPATGQPVKGVPKGSVVTYFGKSVERFAEFFGDIGGVMIPARIALTWLGRL